MRDPERIKKVLAEIEKIWEKYPDLRFGQLIGGIFGIDATDRKNDNISPDNKIANF